MNPDLLVLVKGLDGTTGDDGAAWHMCGTRGRRSPVARARGVGVTHARRIPWVFVHRFTPETEKLARAVTEYTLDRMRMDPPLDGSRPPEELARQAGQTITPEGMGAEAALALWDEVLSTACLSLDHPRYLAFIPSAPTEAASLFDAIVGASSVYGGSWLEGAGAVYAENQALRWIADLAGLPGESGGCFVQGGTVGNLSALIAARARARDRLGRKPAGGWRVAVTGGTHSSVAYALHTVLDCDIVEVPGDERGRLTGPALAAAIDQLPPDDAEGLFAVVATAGQTNSGVVDDLAGVAAIAAERGLWFHIDGAYGGAALAAPSARHLFDGVEHADSLIVDPHKWLFAPLDCCALLYRDPEQARRTHTQTAGYLEPVTVDGVWNPSDYALHLSRRARGLPFWFSLAAHGTDAYTEAIETTLAVARAGAEEIRRRVYTNLLVEPDLSVLLFERVGWSAADYREWSQNLAGRGTAFVMPTTYQGRPATRFAIVNPRTTLADLKMILGTMA